MNKETIFGALVGLAGAVFSNGKTEDTDEIVRRALLAEPSEEILHAIHEEKYRISPDCAVCAAPCGNTSDYDMTQILKNTQIAQKKKALIMQQLCKLAQSEQQSLPESAYKAICYLSYELSAEKYDKVLEQMETDRESCTRG